MSLDSQFMYWYVCVCVRVCGGEGLKQNTSTVAAGTVTSCLNKLDAYWAVHLCVIITGIKHHEIQAAPGDNI